MTEFPESSAQSSGENQAASPRSPALSRLRSLPRRLLSRYGLAALGVVVLGILIYLTVSADGFVRSGELERELLKLQDEIAVLEDENRRLRQAIESLQNDPAYVEDEARKKLGLVRPGEIIYRLAEEPDLGDGRADDPPPGLN